MSEDNNIDPKFSLTELVSNYLEYISESQDALKITTTEHAEKIIERIRQHDREKLKEAYVELRNSSEAYDKGCEIIYNLLNLTK